MMTSEFMLSRFREFVPSKNLENLDVIQVESDCRTAFNIIGFDPDDFEVAFNKAWESSDASTLSDFI